MKRIKPYLQLVRLPNLFTAAADSLAGWLIVQGTLDQPGRWVPVVFASVMTYAGGIVLNDVFDHEIDLRERPRRPLPSGQVSRPLAAWAGGIALALGPVLASLSGSAASLIVALVLAACVLAYDAGLKRTVLGPQFMGSCRGLNFLLGLSQGGRMGGPDAWIAAIALAVFVAGVTWISRSEVEEGKTRGLVAGLVLENVALAALAWSCWRLGQSSLIADSPSLWTRSALGFLVLVIVGLAINRAGWAAYRRPVPDLFQRSVMTGVFALIWLDVSLVAATRGLFPALIVASLWLPTILLGRWLYST